MCALSCEPTQKFFCDSLAGQCSSRKKDLENFQKFWVFRFLATQFGGLFESGSFSHELTQKFSRLPSRLPRGWNFQSWKILRQIFQKFCLRCLATCPGDLYATWYNCEKCVFYAFWIVFKNFQFFPQTFVTIHCLPRLYLSQTHRVTLEKPPFFHHFNFNLQEKGMGFLILTKSFMIIALFSWICELLRFELYVARIWLGLCLLSLGVWVLLSLLFRMLDILVIMIAFFFLEYVY